MPIQLIFPPDVRRWWKLATTWLFFHGRFTINFLSLHIHMFFVPFYCVIYGKWQNGCFFVSFMLPAAYGPCLFFRKWPMRWLCVTCFSKSCTFWLTCHECVKKWDNEECEHGKVTKQEVFIYRVYGLNLRWQTSCFIAHFIWVIKVGWSCKNVLNREVHKKDSKVEIKPLLRLKHMVLFWEIFIKILFQVDKGISNVPLHSIQHPSSTLTQSGNF